MPKQMSRLAALFTVAILLLSGGFNDVHARFSLSNLLSSDRVTAEMHSDKGNEYLESNDVNKAIKSFSKAVKLEPGNAYYHFELGDAYERKGNFRKAIEGYTQAITIDSEEPAYYIMRGYAYHFRKKYAEAIADLTKAIELQPNEASVYYSRGRIYLFQRDYDKAIADFANAVNLEPKNANYLASRGSAYVKKGLYTKAVPDFEAAVAIDPNHVLAIDELAKAEFALAKRDSRLMAHGNAPSRKPSGATDRKQSATQTEQTVAMQDSDDARTGQTVAAQDGDGARTEQIAAAQDSDDARARAERRALAREKLVTVSAQYLGTPYRYGGMGQGGMDCSGFTSIVYKEVYNLNLPRTTDAMWNWKNEKMRDVSVEEARAGDLVFFNNSKNANRAVDHVGIYLGDNKFIHASSSRGVVYNNLTENYYKNNFVGIKRISRKNQQSNS
jgi:cell wall-associated NlpC family hydrolase